MQKDNRRSAVIFPHTVNSHHLREMSDEMNVITAVIDRILVRPFVLVEPIIQ